MPNWPALAVFLAALVLTLLFYISRKLTQLVVEVRQLRLAIEQAPSDDDNGTPLRLVKK